MHTLYSVSTLCAGGAVVSTFYKLVYVGDDALCTDTGTGNNEG